MTVKTEDAGARWGCMLHLGEAQLALKQARDLEICASGSTMAAASIALLHDCAATLLREMGMHFRTLANSDDADTATYVRAVLAKLDADAPAPSPCPTTRPADG